MHRSLPGYHPLECDLYFVKWRTGDSPLSFFFFFYSSQEAFWLNQKEIEAAVVDMRIFLVGLSFTFDANFHEVEEITRRALGAIESEVVEH
jgi:hypothetical protein